MVYYATKDENGRFQASAQHECAALDWARLFLSQVPYTIFHYKCIGNSVFCNNFKGQKESFCHTFCEMKNVHVK